MKNNEVNFELRPEVRKLLTNKKIAIVKANFNHEITDKMLENSIRILKEADANYEVFEVRGCFEIIYAMTTLLNTVEYDGIIPLGCLIKGETKHFKHIAEAVTSAIKDLTIKYEKPIGFGILTCLTKEQAEARTSLGAEATIAVLENICTFS